jgi:acrylyl-CoA reductase (NADPH)
MDLPATVAPFILRGVTLYGIDSVMAPRPVREAAWQRLAAEADAQALAAITTQAGLADAPSLGADILQGRVRGRVVIDVNQ